MFIPFLTTRGSPSRRRELWKRKGGGGGGRGGGGGGGGGGRTSTGSSGGSKSSSGGKGSGGSTFKSSGGKDKTPTQSTSAKSSGSAAVHTIPSGQLFGGRTVGGGTRGAVYGTSAYGSGYPDATGRGTAGRNLPFYFWPVSYGNCNNRPSYVCHSEYGSPTAKNRTGGAQHTAEFRSSRGSSIFYVLSDKDTVNSLFKSIKKDCASKGLVNAKLIKKPQAYKGPDFGKPTPEEAVQYYRASSVGLYLDGYSNAATFSLNESEANTPLPGGVDTELLGCLNKTIGDMVPLANGAAMVGPGQGSHLLLASWLALVLWNMV